MAKLKAYAVGLDGIHVLMVATTNKKAAAALIGTTLYMMIQWVGRINDKDEAIALASPGVVFRKQIGDQTQWERVTSGSS